MELSSSSADRRSRAGTLRAADDAEGSGAGRTPIKLFLVEDSPAVRERLIDYLEAPGKVEVVGYADTERDATARLVDAPVDVAIVDLNLREGSGFGVIDAVRARFPTAPPVLVVLTNYAFAEYERECRRRGADHFFDKSTQFDAVKRLLDELPRRSG